MLDDIELTLGDKIRAVRRARGMTQEEFAQKVGILQCQVAQYETMGILPSIPTLEWICKALNMKASDLLGF